MGQYCITKQMIAAFEERLVGEGKSGATIKKYLRDVRAFYAFLPPDKLADKNLVLAFKAQLAQRYSVVTANSMLAALNSFFRCMGCEFLHVRLYRRQKQMFGSAQKELSKEDYRRLLSTAKALGKDRLWLIMQTICATGIRVSELQFITVEAARVGRCEGNCKGKRRVIFLPRKLRELLIQYAAQEKKSSGMLFTTRHGNPIDRSNLWKDMKQLCRVAGVEGDKVFPHNLRHLFARAFYEEEKDIAKLADLLGHASIETTRIYIMESGDQHQRKLDRLGLVI